MPKLNKKTLVKIFLPIPINALMLYLIWSGNIPLKVIGSIIGVVGLHLCVVFFVRAEEILEEVETLKSMAGGIVNNLEEKRREAEEAFDKYGEKLRDRYKPYDDGGME